MGRLQAQHLVPDVDRVLGRPDQPRFAVGTVAFDPVPDQQARRRLAHDFEAGAGLVGDRDDLGQRAACRAVTEVDQVVAGVFASGGSPVLEGGDSMDPDIADAAVGLKVRDVHRFQNRQIPALLADQQRGQGPDLGARREQHLHHAAVSVGNGPADGLDVSVQLPVAVAIGVASSHDQL